jgi:hypothetical protein
VSDLSVEEETAKIFLSIAAVFAWLFGAGLLLGPFHAPAGVAMTPMVATIAQAHGATLVGLGVINWMARGANRQGLVAVLTGNLVVQILSLGVVLRAVMLEGGPSGTPSIFIHVVLGAFFLFFLLQTKKLPA